jgi:50S ribosome-binding GTPase
VVSVVGLKNVGKSTLANIIANSDYLKDLQNGYQNHIFQTEHANSGNCEGNSLDAFITADRIIILDCSSILLNSQKRDMMVSESDDIKLMQICLQVSHLVIIVHDGFPDMSVSRIINMAEQMSSHESKHRPVFASVANRVQPGSKILQFDSRIHDGKNLLIPDFNHPSVELHHDIQEVIQEFQETVFMMKRWSMIEDEEAFTEKKWGQRLLKCVDQIKKGDYFSRKYEALKDKFHQPVNENC